MLKTRINLKAIQHSVPVFELDIEPSLPVFVLTPFQPQMPLFSIYSLALEQDQEQSVGLQQANATLYNQTFIQVNLKLTLKFVAT